MSGASHNLIQKIEATSQLVLVRIDSADRWTAVVAMINYGITSISALGPFAVRERRSYSAIVLQIMVGELNSYK